MLLTRRRPPVLVRVLLVLLGAVAGVALCEGYTRLALRDVRWPDRWAFRASQPPPYRDAPYFSPAFVQEAARAIGLRLADAGNRLIVDDFHGRWINVRDGRRVTVDQPDGVANRLYLVGASAVFNVEVPDAFTVASYLQRTVNQELPGRFRVENAGIPAATAGQQTELVKSLLLQSGDIVVFYDGANDVTYTVYFLTPVGWRPGETTSIVRRMSWIERTITQHLSAWVPHVALLRALQVRVDESPPAHFGNDRAVRALSSLLARQRASAIREAEAAVRGAGATFYSFVQPDIFDLPGVSEYRRSLVENPLLTPPGLGRAFRETAPVVSRISAELGSAGVRAADLSGVLTPLSAHEEVYLDYVHVNHRANEVIAGEIFRQVFRREWPTPTIDARSAVLSVVRLPAEPLVPDEGTGVGPRALYRLQQTVYAIPRGYGDVWWSDVDVQALPGVVTGGSLAEVVSRVRQADEARPGGAVTARDSR
jgi:hypothetical protein